MEKRYTILPKTWLRCGLTVAFATAFSFSLQAQTAPAKAWDKTIGSISEDKLKSFVLTSDGGYILVGRSNGNVSADKTQPLQGTASQNGDFWIVKLDANRIIEWDKDYGGIHDDVPAKVRQTSDGGYIIVGFTKSGITGNKLTANKGGNDYWMVKLNQNGTKVWEKTFGGNMDDYATDILQTADGGYLVSGRSNTGLNGDKSQASKGGFDYWVIKTDASGNKLWDKTFGTNGTELLTSILTTSDGGYILGGSSDAGINGDKTQPSKGSGWTDYWLVKIDANGNKLWDKAYGGPNLDDLSIVKQTADGGFILGGDSYSGIGGDKSQANRGFTDFWVIKTDAAGNKQWDKNYGSNDYDYLVGIEQTTDGGYILAGSSITGISGDKTTIINYSVNNTNDYWAVKLDGTGAKIWDRVVGSTSDDILAALQLSADGGIVFGGTSMSGIGPTGSGSYKSEGSKGGTANYDYWIVKLGGNISGIKETDAYFSLTIFPNPSHGKFNLLLGNLNAPTADISVSDLLGRIVLQKQVQTTNNQLSEELILPNTNGIYLLQVNAGGQVMTRKIVVE